jgi:hypothetical protein
MTKGDVISDRVQDQHEAAIRLRKWISTLGSIEQSETEVRNLIATDPGRVARDEVASGHAVLSSENFDRWCGERLSGDWLAMSNMVQKSDKNLRILSADANLPLFTTAEQENLENEVLELATRLAKTKDPLFDRAKLDQAIKEESKAIGFEFSPEQLRVFDLLEYRFGVVQGEAGSGKSTLMAVQRRYCELTKRDIAGFATSQLAAEGLGEKAKIDSKNTARAQALENARGEEMIKPNSRAILDEASMLSLESVHATLLRLEEKGAGGLFIGDEAQLPNISAGDTGRLLASVAKSTGRYVEVTQVFRQKGPEVSWMKEAVPLGARAIREGDTAGFRAYLEKFIDRGHVSFHSNRQEEITAKAKDVVAAVRKGIKVLAPGYSHPECLYTNRAIRKELGHEDTGINFRMARGIREIAPKDRVIFEKNNEKKTSAKGYEYGLGVLNGYTGTVRSVTPDNIEIEMDKGHTVNVNPAKYNHIEYGWACTTHKSQGRGDPLVVPTLGKGDNARSAHVALTRCETSLHVHTRMSKEALIDHLSSSNSLRPKDDVIFFQEIVRQTGGPDTYWAQSVRVAMDKENDPLRYEHRAETRLRIEACRRDVVSTMERFNVKRASAPNDGALKRIEREEKKEIDGIYKRHELESFVAWATRNRKYIEVSVARSMEQAQERKNAMKPQVQAQEQTVKKGRGR